MHRYDTAALIKACETQELDALTEEGALFDKMCTLYHLDDTLGCDVELVCFGLSASTHFSEVASHGADPMHWPSGTPLARPRALPVLTNLFARFVLCQLCWVVNAAHLFPFDSCRSAGHMTIVSNTR